MVKYDPKLMKKINPSKLIAAAKEAGVKNAEKVSKELLVPAFLETIEKTDQEKLTASMVEMYNEIVTTLGLDKESGGGEAPAAEEVAAEAPVEEVAAEAPVPAPVPTPVPKAPVPKLAPKAAPAPAAPVATPLPKLTPKAPVPAVPKAAAVPKEPKPKAEKKPRPERYTRIKAMVDQVAKMKGSGKLDDLYNGSNQKYMEKGGTDKIVEATFFCNIGLSFASAIGAVEVTEDSFKLAK